MKKLLVMLVFVLTSQVFAQDIDSLKLDTGVKLIDQEQYDEAKEVFETFLVNNDDCAEVHFYLAVCLFKLGDLDEAINHGEKAAELDDKNANCHLFLGQLYFAELTGASKIRAMFISGKVKEQFKKTVELNPDHLQGNMSLAYFYLHTPGMFGGDIEKAFEHSQIVLTIDEKQGRLLLHQVYNQKENFNKAETELKLLEEKFGEDPEFYYLYNYYGYFLLNQGRVDEAIEKFKKQVSLAPEEANPYDSLGEAYRIKGMLVESLKEYQKAYNISPSEKVNEIIADLNKEIESI